MSRRLADALAALQRVDAALEELESLVSEPAQYVHEPAQLTAEAVPAAAAAVQSPQVLAHTRHRSRAAARMARRARAAALPAALAASLGLFGLLRLPPANTLWFQELTLTSRTETGEFHCDPVTLLYVGLAHPTSTSTTLTYALTGGGSSGGVDCLQKDISNVSIEVCFDPELGEDAVLSEKHPGAGTAAWKYGPKNSGVPKLVKWDSKTTSSPLGGKGPFHPDLMTFSITVGAHIEPDQLIDVSAHVKAGPSDIAAGTVKAPACPLPAETKASTVVDASAVVEPTAEPTADNAPTPTPSVPALPAGPINGTPGDDEPESRSSPAQPGPVGVGPSGTRVPTPTPTVKPVGVAINGR